MASYIEPTEVVSPREHWQLEEVLHAGGPGELAVALGTWDGERRIALRWNGSEQTSKIGNPQSSGNPTWFMLPGEYTGPVLWLLSLPKPGRGVLAAIEAIMGSVGLNR